MGTANYFSPEQAQGRAVDPRSDLYSLGVVLYELLVGEPPFRGENPVTIAYKHVQEAPVPPRARGVDVAESLEAITLKLLAKNPAHRYPSAEDLRADLRRYREGAHQLARAASPAVRGNAGVAVPGAIDAAAHTAAQQRVGAVLAPAHTGGGGGQPPRRTCTARTGAFAVLIVLVLIVLLAILILLLTDGKDDGGGGGATVAVPSLINRTRDEAESALQAAGLKSEVEEKDNTQYEAGKVFQQDPAGGNKVDPGTTVHLVVSKGNSSVLVTNVIALPVDDAELRLRSQGFDVERVPDTKSTRPDGEVTKQDPVPGTSLTAGGKVTITFSSPEEKDVPDVANQPAFTAGATLTKAGFEVEERTEASDTVEQGKVIRTDPKAGSKLKVGEKIVIFTSSGSAQVLVPDVGGVLANTADQTITQAGLVTDPRFQDLPAGSSNIGRVISQNPPGNTQVRKGSTVIITVGRAASSPTTTAGSGPTTTAGSGPTTTKNN
jgi:serine/threonine-protein kinase